MASKFKLEMEMETQSDYHDDPEDDDMLRWYLKDQLNRGSLKMEVHSIKLKRITEWQSQSKSADVGDVER